MTNTLPMPARRPAIARKYPVCPLEKVLDTVKSKCGDVDIVERHGKGTHKVILLPEASHELEVMISYGRLSPMNVLEQKYAGFGHFLNDEDGSVITIVKHFIEIQTMNRNAVGASNLGPNGENNPGLDFLEYHREEFLRTEKQYNTDAFGFQVDPFLKLCGPSEFVLEGHTHPKLGVFFSSTDRISGAARAASSPVCIFVCDPVQKKMLGSIGKGFEDAEVLMFSRCISGSTLSGSILEKPAEEIVRLAGQCLRTKGYSGRMKYRSRRNGKSYLKLNMVVPKTRKGES